MIYGITIRNSCTNPSSMWFKDQSFELITRNYLGVVVETESKNILLESLKPGLLDAGIESSD